MISGPNSDITLVKKILEATQPDPVIEDFPVVTLDVIYQLFQENNINLNNFLKLIMRNLSVFDGNHLSHVVKFLQNHSNNFSDNVLCEVFLYLYKNKNKNVIDYFLIHFQSALKKGTVQNIHLIDYALKMVDSDLLRMLVKAGIDREKSLGQHEWEQLLINEDKKLNDTLTQLTEEKPSTALAKQTLSLGSPYHEEEIKSIRQTFFSSMDSKLKKNAERPYSTILTNDNKLFTIRDSIGAGGRSKIKLAYHHSRKNWCVVKIIKINKDFLFSKKKEDALREIEIMKSLGSLIDSNLIESDDYIKYYIFTDYVPGLQLYGLNCHLSAGKISLSQMHEVELYLNLLLEFRMKLINNGVTHGDLHDGNVIFDPSTRQVTFVDFGDAFQSEEDMTSIFNDFTEIMKDMSWEISNLKLRLLMNRLKKSTPENFLELLDSSILKCDQILQELTQLPAAHRPNLLSDFDRKRKREKGSENTKSPQHRNTGP